MKHLLFSGFVLLMIPCVSGGHISAQAPGFAGDETADAKRFKKNSEDAIGKATRYFQGEGVVPGLELFPLLEKVVPDLKNFPDELKTALACEDKNKRIAAVKYLTGLVTLARWNDSERDRDDQFRCALGQHAQPIQITLERIVKRAEGDEAVLAAAALLALQPEHRGALAIVVAELRSQDRRRMQEACEMVESMRLSHTEIVTALAQAITGKDAEVRQSATRAVWKIGYKAKSTVPALIDLLRSRKPVYGTVFPFEYPKDIGLLALVAMKADARPAVPVMADMLKKASLEDRLELLRCLASLGPNAKEAIPAIGQFLAGRMALDRITAAATLLCIDPDDAKAADILSAALKGDDPDARALSLEMCRDVGPKPRFDS